MAVSALGSFWGPTLELAFTRYLFTSRLVCRNQPSFHPPRPPALPTLVQYYCTIIGQYTTPLPTPRVCAIHHTILVITKSCKGQVGPLRLRVGWASWLSPSRPQLELALTLTLTLNPEPNPDPWVGRFGVGFLVWLGPTFWPLLDILSRLGLCARMNPACIAHPHLHCRHDCSTIAILLRNTTPPTDLPFVWHTPYNIGNGKIV